MMLRWSVFSVGVKEKKKRMNEQRITAVIDGDHHVFYSTCVSRLAAFLNTNFPDTGADVLPLRRAANGMARHNTYRCWLVRTCTEAELENQPWFVGAAARTRVP
jgi:hypothetical protein